MLYGFKYQYLHKRILNYLKTLTFSHCGAEDYGSTPCHISLAAGVDLVICNSPYGFVNTWNTICGENYLPQLVFSCAEGPGA